MSTETKLFWTLCFALQWTFIFVFLIHNTIIGVSMAAIQLLLNFDKTIGMLYLTFKAQLRAFMSTIPFSDTFLDTFEIIMPRWVTGCNWNIMTIAFTTVTAIHPHLAYLMASTFWYIIEIFWLPDFSHRVVILAFKRQLICDGIPLWKNL